MLIIRTARPHRSLAAAAAVLLLAGGAFLVAPGTASATSATPVVDGDPASFTFSIASGAATVTGYTGVATDISIPAHVTSGGTDYPVTTIGTRAFQDDGLTSVAIPSSVTTIVEAAFQGNALTSVVVPDSVVTIGTYAFALNPALASVTLGSSVQTIDIAAFQQDALTSVVIPDSVTTIDRFAFYQNPGLSSVTLGRSVQTIGVAAFQQDALNSIVIPSSVTSIGNFALAGNTLTAVRFVGDEPTTVGSFLFQDNVGDITIYHAEGAAGFSGTTWHDLPSVVAVTPTLASSLPSGTVGVPYSAGVAGGGVPTPRFAVTAGTLPVGLSLDATTGAISGVPAAAGSFPITVSATSLSGTAQTALTVTVAKGTIPAGTPTISGTAAIGKTLTAVAPVGWSGATVTYRWTVGSTVVSTSRTYTVPDRQGGTTLRLTVVGSRQWYEQRTSTTVSVTIPRGTLTGARPKIAGKAKVGKTLKASSKKWGPTRAGKVKLSYQWYRGKKKVSGATKARYPVKKADAGKRITVAVTGKATGYTTLTEVSTARRVTRR